MADAKRDIKQAYAAGDQDLMALVDWPWPSVDLHTLIAGRASRQVPRALLVEELLSQNEHLPQADASLENIRLLSKENTFTIATGHQVCLMGGPMFTLYKIASAIAMANDLAKRFPDLHFVPVLWMATEDHDWEEVNHFYMGFSQKIVYPGQFVGPVGRHVLEPSILDVLPSDFPEDLKAFYAPGRTMAEAFRSLMHHLFGQFGLVILDADRPALKRAFLGSMEKELLGTGMAAAVRASTQALEDLGFKTQIYPRDINLFYLGEGRRQLIDRQDDGFKLKDGDRRWTLAEMLAELKDSPEQFSPNVALRPVYQETLLPNLAYFGGWAEVSYWLQLRDGFENHGVFYPMVVPRLHATLVEHDAAQAWLALRLPLTSIAAPIHVLNDLYLSQDWDEEPLSEAIHAVDVAFMHLAGMVEQMDPTLATGIRAEQARSDNAFDGLRKKLKKSLRNRNPQPYQAIATIKNAVEPENVQQQRTLNFTAFPSINPQQLMHIIVKHADWHKAEGQWIQLS